MNDSAHATPTWQPRRTIPEAVTFDCWNTLIYESDWTLAHARRVDALVSAVAQSGRSIDRDSASRAFDAAWTRHMDLWRAGVASGAREVAHWALSDLGVEPTPATLERLVHSYEEASHSRHVAVLDGARRTLERLAGAGVRCGLVCDTGLTPGRVVRRHLAVQGVLDLLDVTVFSDEIGVPKPDIRTFQTALEALGAPAERAVHVGDLLATDVAGARAAGMGTIRLRARHDDTGEYREADAVADSHAELPALLGLPRDAG